MQELTSPENPRRAIEPRLDGESSFLRLFRSNMPVSKWPPKPGTARVARKKFVCSIAAGTTLRHSLVESFKDVALTHSGGRAYETP